MSSVSPRAQDSDPVRIIKDPDPDWFSESRASMERQTQKVCKQKKRRRLKLSKIFIQ